MTTSIDAILRRVKPQKRSVRSADTANIAPQMLQDAHPLPPKILYDTTVYIDALGGRFPVELELKARSTRIWHCATALAELTYLCGKLDPLHSATEFSVEKIEQTLSQVPEQRLLAPDYQIWLDAGVLSGTVDRLQGKPAGSTLNDALIFLTALKHGCTVLTRNQRDFHAFQQLLPEARTLFYTASLSS